MPTIVDNLEFSPAPLLEAFSRFRGGILDLSSGMEFKADQLKVAEQSLCRQMVERGVSHGDGVVVAIPNGPLFPVVMTAILEAGAAPVLVHFETPMEELKRTSGKSGARFVVTESLWSSDLAQDVPITTLECGDLRSVSLAELAGPGVSPWAGAVYASPLHPTSGTTNEPKTAVRPGPCAVAEATHYIETLDITQSDVIACITPMSHAYAYGMCYMVSLLSSACLVTMRSFNPKLVRQALSELNVTILPVVPAMADILLLGSSNDSITWPRYVLSAGAPLGKRTADQFSHRYGIKIRPLYGTTETGGISIATGDNDFDGSVGPPMNGVEVRLRSAETDNYGAQAGILQVRSSSMMSGYLERGAINSDPIRGGWFETGDIARIDDEGRITLLGRESESINVFGMKVIPSEVEAVISLMPGVVEVKVYARAHKSGSDTVAAAIVTSEKIEEDKIRRHCEQHLVRYKCPSVIRFLDSLPRTPSGKILARQLREELS